MAKKPPIKGVDICLLDGQEGQECEGEPIVRGLCQKHRRQWEREREELADDDARKEFDEGLIAKGMLLESQKPGPKKKMNPFRQIAIEMNLIPPTPTEERAAATGLAAIHDLKPDDEAPPDESPPGKGKRKR